MDPFIFKLIASGIVAFLAVAGILPRMRRLAIRNGFVDMPGGRKDHEEIVPPIGGLVVFPVFTVLALAAGMDLNAYWPLLTALALILMVGALDDYLDIKASFKFFIQFVAALLIVVKGGVVVESLGDFFGTGPLELGIAAIPFTVFCVMLLINAINMMDGLDGLAGGMGTIILFWMLVAEIFNDVTGKGTAIFLVLLIGALGGFLISNMRTPFNKRAKVFLGDSGSMALGLILAWFSIRLSQPPHHTLVPISVAWIVALPVIDAFGLFMIRIFSGRHPFSADRLHFHHRFIHAGVPPGKATVIILVTGFVLGLTGFLGTIWDAPEYLLTYAWIGLLGLHTFFTVKSEKFITFLTEVFGTR